MIKHLEEDIAFLNNEIKKLEKQKADSTSR
jgi:uncharacterized small protein (DUF1192 family)